MCTFQSCLQFLERFLRRVREVSILNMIIFQDFSLMVVVSVQLSKVLAVPESSACTSRDPRCRVAPDRGVRGTSDPRPLCSPADARLSGCPLTGVDSPTMDLLDRRWMELDGFAVSLRIPILSKHPLLVLLVFLMSPVNGLVSRLEAGSGPKLISLDSRDFVLELLVLLGPRHVRSSSYCLRGCQPFSKLGDGFFQRSR